MTSESAPTALDKIIGSSPHLAAATDFGLFCPACSDPLKLSFVSASSCPLARETASRTEQYSDIAMLMVRAGLKPLLPNERSKQIEAHQIAFKRARNRRKDRDTDSL